MAKKPVKNNNTNKLQNKIRVYEEKEVKPVLLVGKNGKANIVGSVNNQIVYENGKPKLYREFKKK